MGRTANGYHASVGKTRRTIRTGALEFIIEGEAGRGHGRHVRRGLGLFDTPTLRRFHDGVELSDGNLRPPLSLVVGGPGEMVRRIWRRRPLFRLLLGHFLRQEADTLSGFYHDRGATLCLAPEARLKEVVHELAHAALHFDPARGTGDRGRFLDTLATDLETHRERQLAACGLSAADVARAGDLWEQGQDADETLDRAEFEELAALMRKARRGFASSYAFAGPAMAGEGKELEEYLVESWSAYLIRGPPTTFSRARLRRRDPVLSRALAAFVRSREEDASCAEQVATVRAALAAGA